LLIDRINSKLVNLVSMRLVSMADLLHFFIDLVHEVIQLVHNLGSNVPDFLLDFQRCAGNLAFLADEVLPQRLQFSLVLNQGPLVVEEVLPHFVDVDRLLEARQGVVDAVFNHFLEVDVVLVQRFRVQL